MSVEFIDSLATACFALSASSLFVMLVRRPMRHLFGSAIAYVSWVVVPLATIASLLPASSVPPIILAVKTPVRDVVPVAHAMSEQTGTWSSMVTAVRGLGALVMLVSFVMQHLRFVGSLGTLDRRHKIAIQKHTGPHDTGPLLLGLWRPVVVMPENFRRRYTARERRLIVLHERIHLRRHDPALNALCAGLQCVFWFDPLIHVAARVFRLDQELACDDLVMQRHPGMPRSYASALIKSQTTSSWTPFACHWISTQPLKERFMELQRTRIASGRRIFGKTLVGIATVAITCGTWAAQSDAPTIAGTQVHPQTYDIAMTLIVDGHETSPRLRTIAGVPVTLQFGSAPAMWTIVVECAPSNEGRVMARSHMRYGNEAIANPALLLSLGQPGTAHIGADSQHPAIDMTLTVAASTKS